MYDCINRPDTRLHPTKTQKTSSQPLQCGSHPHRTFSVVCGNGWVSPVEEIPTALISLKTVVAWTCSTGALMSEQQIFAKCAFSAGTVHQV
jgi:hypothetical protein